MNASAGDNIARSFLAAACSSSTDTLCELRSVGRRIGIGAGDVSAMRVLGRRISSVLGSARQRPVYHPTLTNPGGFIYLGVRNP